MEVLEINIKTGEQTIKTVEDIIIPEPTINVNYEISSRIRARYSLDEEFAIQRQRESKYAEFLEYNTFCEQVKSEVKLMYPQD